MDGCNFFPVSLQNSIPFAVIGSNVQVESKGRKVRGRSYPWGVVEGIDAEAGFLGLFSRPVHEFMHVVVVARVSGGSSSL